MLASAAASAYSAVRAALQLCEGTPESTGAGRPTPGVRTPPASRVHPALLPLAQGRVRRPGPMVVCELRGELLRIDARHRRRRARHRSVTVAQKRQVARHAHLAASAVVAGLADALQRVIGRLGTSLLGPRLIKELFKLAQSRLHRLLPLRAESLCGAALPPHLAEEEGQLEVFALRGGRDRLVEVRRQEAARRARLRRVLKVKTGREDTHCGGRLLVLVRSELHDDRKEDTVVVLGVLVDAEAG